MKQISTIAFFTFLLHFSGLKAQTDSFVVDGLYRSYILHLPSGYTSSRAYPLVMNLHGYTSNAIQEEVYTNMDASADANGYIVVYPNGIANYWNSWGPPGATYGANDVKFLTELIDTISVRYHVNANRVYSCGISNGGYMTYTLACSIADRLAAIASVSGTMSLNTYSTCNPSRKIPVLHVHGTSDPVVPYATGATGSIGAEQTVAFWRDTDACANSSDTLFVPNTDVGDSSTVQIIRYQNCPASNEVLFYKIINGGHTWPGAAFDISNYGNTNHDISATDEIWAFFNRYTLTGPNGLSEISTDPAISLSPNPAGSRLSIIGAEGLTGTTIYDLTGRDVLISGAHNVIDIESISSGIYVAVIHTGTGQSRSLRFVKE